MSKLNLYVEERNPDLLPFVNSICILNEVDDIVNKEKLEDNFEEGLDHFKQSFEVLKDKFNVSETNKINVINSHLADFLRRTEETLLKCSDQTV